VQTSCVNKGTGNLRCLLISPVAPIDPDNGDAQFTRDLLADPPGGIDYVTYTDALALGEIAWGPSIRSPWTWRRPLSDPAAALARASLHELRRRGALLPDPVRWLTIKRSFDLIHVHCMPVRFLGKNTAPIVVSDSAGTFWYWTAGRGMEEARVERLLRRERLLAGRYRYLHPSANPDLASRAVVFVEGGKALQAQVGADVAGTICCPPGVPDPVRTAERTGKRLVFVARDFQLKGGDVALKIYETLRSRISGLRLTVAGSALPDPQVDGVDWIGSTDRSTLYRDVYPSADIFVYPTRFDCAPLVVMEALAHGIPVVAPRIFAIPELVVDGVTGILHDPNDLHQAIAAVEALLIDPVRRAVMGSAAKADFQNRLSTEHRNMVLGQVYRKASQP